MNIMKRLCALTLALVLAAGQLPLSIFAQNTDHTHSYTASESPATCTAAHTVTYSCECSDSYTETLSGPLGHQFGEFSVTQAPSCTAAGSMVRVCSTCSGTETQSIDKLAHTFGEFAAETAATCTKEGTEKRICSVCQGTETRTTPKIAHSFGDFAEETPATCTKEGTEKRICSVCQGTETRTTPKIAHSFGEFAAETEATCTKEGAEKRICSVCQGTETRTTPKIAHSFGEFAAETEATCTKEGTEKRVCSVCEGTETRTVPKLVHSFGAFVVVQAATCLNEGTQTRTCAYCQGTESQTIPKIDHAYGPLTFNGTRHQQVCTNLVAPDTQCGDTLCQDCQLEFKWNEQTHWQECRTGTHGNPKVRSTSKIDECPHYLEWRTDNTTNTHWQECTLSSCGYTTEANREPHSPSGELIVVPSTCSAAGRRYYLCECSTELPYGILPLRPHKLETLEAVNGVHNGVCQYEDCKTILTDTSCSTYAIRINDTQHQVYCFVTGHTVGNPVNHTWTLIPARGSEKEHYYKCSVCGDFRLEAHKFELRRGKAATCAAPGRKDYNHCTVCNMDYLPDGTHVSADSLAIPNDNVPHTLTKVPKKDATCLEPGNEFDYWHCSVCSRNFDSAAGTRETTPQAIPATGAHDHTGKALHRTTATTHQLVCKTCGTVNSAQQHDFQDSLTCMCGYKHIHTTAYTHTTATCAQAGSAGYYICRDSLCPLVGQKFSDEKLETPAPDTTGRLNHQSQWKEVKEVAATCKDTGMAAHFYCETCKLYFKADKTWVENKNALVLHTTDTHADKALEKDDTHHWEICSLCLAETGTRTEHDPEDGICTTCGYDAKHECEKCLDLVAAVPATCKQDGTKAYNKCRQCGKLYGTDKPLQEITDPATLVDPLQSHRMTKVLFTSTTQHQFGCEYCDYPEKAQDHKFETNLKCACGLTHTHTVKFVASAATCAKDGYPAHYYCEDTQCPVVGKHYSDEALKKPLEANANDDKRNHSLSLTPETKPTCKDEGMLAHYYCATCKIYFNESKAQVEKSALTIDKTNDHNPSNVLSYDADGHWYACLRCAEKIGEETHTLGWDGICNLCYYNPEHRCATSLSRTAGKAATCKEPGKKDVYTCSYCGKKYLDNAATVPHTDAGEIIPVLAHTFDTASYVFDTQKHWHVCKFCDAVKDGSAVSHTPADGPCICGYTKDAYMKSVPGAPVQPGQSATFISTAKYEDLLYVLLDGNQLTSGYTVFSGSTVVTLTPALISTLSPGPHTLAIVSKTGTAIGSFTVAEKPRQVLYFAYDPVVKTAASLPFANPLVHELGDGKISYGTSAPGVAVVDASGNVTITGTGACYITAYASETAAYRATSTSFLLLVSPVDSGDNPKTGDTIGASVALMALSAAGLWLLLTQRKQLLSE